MNEYLLKIIELLDKDGLVDKEYKLGCIYKLKNGWIVLATEDWEDLDQLAKDEIEKIIGQIHLGSILQFIEIYADTYNVRLLKKGIEFISGEPALDYKFTIDTKTPVMKQSNKYCKEVYDFIMLIKKQMLKINNCDTDIKIIK